MVLAWSRDRDRAQHQFQDGVWSIVESKFESKVLLFTLRFVLISPSIVMPGDNCSVFGCGTSRRTKGVGIWKLPKAKDAAYKKWREDWLGEITKTRVLDRDFKRQVENDKVFICEKHFHPEDIETCK